jgi:hypothetical protein
MKRILQFVIVSLFVVSCSLNQKEVIILKILDQFDTQKENEQLGIDMLNYKFQAFLQTEFPDLSEDVFKNISWQYFVQKNNKEVSFRLTLSNNAIAYKERISDYFEIILNEQVYRQVHDKQIFDKAISSTLETFAQLDKGDTDSFWDKTSAILRDRTSKSNFFESIKGRDGISEKGGDRVLLYKQYYESLPGVDETGFYVVCFTFEKDKKMIEQLTYHYQGDTLKITGYDYRTPN